jgi:hypothetical protein
LTNKNPDREVPADRRASVEEEEPSQWQNTIFPTT